MELAHSDLAEVAGVVFVEEDAVVVQTSGVTSAARMLSVLADTAVACAHVATLLAVFLESGSHWRRVWGFGMREGRKMGGVAREHLDNE